MARANKITLLLCLITTLMLGGWLMVAPQTSQALAMNYAVIVPPSGGGSGGTGSSANPAATGPHNPDPAMDPKVACNQNSCPLIKKYVNPTIALLSGLVGVVAVIAIIVGGIEFSSAGGDPQKSANGKKHIRNAIIGVVAYLFLYAFLKFILLGGIS